jgi:hypothetical protein
VGLSAIGFVLPEFLVSGCVKFCCCQVDMFPRDIPTHFPPFSLRCKPNGRFVLLLRRLTKSPVYFCTFNVAPDSARYDAMKLLLW